MSKIALIIRCGSASALLFVLLAVSVSAQTPPATAPSTLAPETTGMMPPSMTGGPMMGMSGMGAYGSNDPEMQAFLNRRLQNLRMAEMQLNDDITMTGGDTSPAARQLIMQRAQLQGQIRQLEQQLGMGMGGNPMTGMGTAGMGMPGSYGMSGMTPAEMAMPGGMGDNPMVGMQPGTMVSPMGAASMANPMMGNAPYGMPGTGMGVSPDRMMLEQLREDAMLDLRYAQRALSFFDNPNDPARKDIEARQSELLKQIESLNQQLGQGSNAGTQPTAPSGVSNNIQVMRNIEAVSAPSDSLAASILAQQQAQQAAARSAIFDPELMQMRDAERQLRAMGDIAAADMLLRRIEEKERFSSSLGNTALSTPDIMLATNPIPMMAPPVMPRAIAGVQPTTTDVVRQAEMLELQSTVESLRNEIASMREEIHSLETLLRQFNQLPPTVPADRIAPAPTSADEL